MKTKVGFIGFGTAGRQPNLGEIYRKPELADCGNDFSNTL